MEAPHMSVEYDSCPHAFQSCEWDFRGNSDASKELQPQGREREDSAEPNVSNLEQQKPNNLPRVIGAFSSNGRTLHLQLWIFNRVFVWARGCIAEVKGEKWLCPREDVFRVNEVENSRVKQGHSPGEASSTWGQGVSFDWEGVFITQMNGKEPRGSYLGDEQWWQGTADIWQRKKRKVMSACSDS